ncbi:MAG: hypothetical protein DYG94_05855 [Leptolyngbya sp. PLA3]|nr:MAG: hypothetical protein EDM82_03715 [Cyanobacteria bacterium CYA]MCE7968255.1 hypothetical protein [Leptolyngbya sp. PL-A3]
MASARRGSLPWDWLRLCRRADRIPGRGRKSLRRQPNRLLRPMLCRLRRIPLGRRRPRPSPAPLPRARARSCFRYAEGARSPGFWCVRTRRSSHCGSKGSRPALRSRA